MGYRARPTVKPKSLEGSVFQLGSRPLPARPRARCLVTRRRTATGATDYQKDTGAERQQREYGWTYEQS